MRLVIEDGNGNPRLEVVSDGHARYTIKGDSLRDNVEEYDTDDDLHVVGLVTWMLGAMNSREYLHRRLAEHEAEQA